MGKTKYKRKKGICDLSKPQNRCRGEYDDYKLPFLGKDTPGIRAIAEKAKEDAIRLAEELDRKYGAKTK